MKRNHLYRFLLVVLLGFSGPLFAEGDNAKIVLTFEKRDSINTCKALVTSNDTPVKEIEVKLYVQRMFSLLPVGDAVATDEEGISSFEFPNDIPADLDGKLTVFAKVEDDENLGNLEGTN